MLDLLDSVKTNLVLEHDNDDYMIQQLIVSAIDYAERYQHIETGFYENNEMSPSTRQAVIMLASHFYESRDGATAGFFYDNTQAGQQVWTTVNNLLRLDREWKV